MKGHIRQRSNGKWEFSIPVGKNPDGSKKRVTGGGFSSEEKAEKAMLKKLYEIYQGMHIEPSKITVNSYFLDWIDLKKSQVKHTSYTAFLGYMRKHVSPIIGHVLLSKLTTQQIQQVYKEMNKSSAPQTVKHVHNMLKQGLDRAVKLKLISENPARLCLIPKVERKDPNCWDVEELKQFLDFAKSSRWYLAFLLAAYTGARQGELLALRWENIDFQKGTVTIRHSLSKTENGYVPTSPKTRSSIRTIGLPPLVIHELLFMRDVLHVDEVNKLVDARLFNKPKDFIVHTYDGKPVNPHNFIKAWIRIIKKSGLRRIRFHDLRHTHATMLLTAGVNMKAISARLGHSTVKMTLDTYSHLVPQIEDGVTTTLEHLLI